MSFKTASTIPYCRTVYAIRHKPTGLLATNVYFDGENFSAQYSFSSLPELFSNRNKMPEMGDEYETIELDLIELKAQNL